MTRFARASGSKSSNQRIPEDSTPWSQLKEQVGKSKEPEEDQENETNWKSVLDIEKKIEENKKSVWCEFEDVNEELKTKKGKEVSSDLKPNSTNKKRSSVEETEPSKLNSKKHKKAEIATDDSWFTSSECWSNNSNSKDKKSKINASKRKYNFHVEELPDVSEKLKLDDNDSPSKEEKSQSFIEESESHFGSELKEDNQFKHSLKAKKKHKKNNKFKDSSKVVCPENEGPGSVKYNTNEVIEDSMEDQENNTRSIVDPSVEHKENSLTQENKKFSKRNNSITCKKEKKNGQPYKRRKCDEGDVKLDINGQEIWVTRLDGFYIRKEDAERIRQLEKDLLKRGVSNQEVRAVVKKERRNAEKALARQKKKVCFHCRKGGHTLSSCPKLNENGAQITGSGICYKCGSTEHTHFQCKVNTGQSYKFATCFVCKQEGHISRQCPDNPRGMYPSGGGCRLCGDVTHFKRECPTLQAKSDKVTVGIIGEDIETLGEPGDFGKPKMPPKGGKRKIIKFT